MTAQTDRRRRVAVAAGLTVLLIAAAALLVRVGRPPVSARDEGAQVRPSGDTSAGAESVTAEPGAESPRDEEGAVSAAVRYSAASQRWLYLSDDQVAAAVTGIATPEAVRSLVDQTVEEIRVAREELANSSGRVWWLVHPLAWRVESFNPDSASVDVWTVTVLSATGVAVPQTEWMTVTVDLAWVGDGWRVDAVRDRPGPTPMTGPRDDPWDAQRFDDALDGFHRLDREAAG